MCWLASYRRPARVFVRAATAEHHLAVAFACLWWRRFYHQWLVQASRPSGRRGQLPSLSRLVASAAAATAATNSAEGAVGLTTRVAVAFDRPVRGGGGAAAAGGAWAPLALAVAAVAPSPLAGGGGAEEGAEVALEAAGWKPQGSVVAGGFASVWQCTVTLPPGTTRLALMSGAEGALLSDQRGSACTVASVLGRWSEGPVAAEEAEAEAHSRTVLEGQIQMLGELLEVEPSAKWGLFTQTKLLLELQSAAAAAAATSHGSVNGSVTMDGGALTSADIIPAPDAQEPEREPKPDEEVVEATVAAIIDPPASMPEAQGVAAVASNPEEEYEESYTQLLGGFAELLSRALARGCAWALPVTSQLLDHTREGLYHCEEWVRKP